jgi:uncharacterized protein YeaC (DUF1315 family)
MDYQQLIDSMTPEVYRNLQRAIELGKWPDGRPLSPGQREDVMQAIIVWGQNHLPEQDRIGYIDKGHKAGDSCEEPEETPLSWNN